MIPPISVGAHELEFLPDRPLEGGVVEDVQMAGWIPVEPVRAEEPRAKASSVRGDANQGTRGCQELAALAQRANRVGHVLDHVGHADGIEGLRCKCRIVEMGYDERVTAQPLPGGARGGGVRLDARNLPAEVAHPFEEETRAAADVEQASPPGSG